MKYIILEQTIVSCFPPVIGFSIAFYRPPVKKVI
jgi:hypothetical protein